MAIPSGAPARNASKVLVNGRIRGLTPFHRKLQLHGAVHMADKGEAASTWVGEEQLGQPGDKGLVS